MKIFEIKTTNAYVIKNLVEALKDILTESTIMIRKEGMYIVDVDTSLTLLVKLELDGSKFEEYTVNEEIDIGIEVLTFYRILKHLTQNDSLILSMDSNQRSQLVIRVDNTKRQCVRTHRMTLSDLDYEKPNTHTIDYDTIITIPALEFQHICKNMKENSNKVVITKVANEIQFSSESSAINSVITYPVCKFNDSENKTQCYYLHDNPDIIYRGIFSLDSLISFTKCTSLCNFVELYMKNDCPIDVKYSVASLGTIRLMLSNYIHNTT
jgi:proliferating cell nuclear antigen